jgi:hypothetical protein
LAKTRIDAASTDAMLPACPRYFQHARIAAQNALLDCRLR